MAECDELASRLWRAVQASRGLPELLALLDTIDTHRQQGHLDNSDYLHLLRAAFGAIHTITLDDSATAESVIMERLVPSVLQAAPEGDHDTQIELSNLRKLLANWIDTHPDQTREELRQRVLTVLMGALEGERLRPACWTIAEIGFRDKRVVDTLWSIVETDSEQRGTALSAIVNLGVPNDMRERLLKVIETDVRDGLPRRLHYVLQEMAAPETVEHVLQFIERLRNEDKDFRLDLALAQSLLKRIVDSSWNDQELQSRVWARLSQIADEELSGGRTEFDLRSEVGEDCNTPDVIQYFLKTLVEIIQGKNGKVRAPWLPLMRLNECFRPLHMDGWKKVGDCTEFIETLGQLAREDTKHDIGVVTTESRAKKDVWNHLLSIGARQAFDWVEDAVANETSPHVQSDVLECAACLAFSNLPPSVIRLVTEEFNAEPKTNAGQFVARLGATELARSAATLEAFNVLLDFGLTHGGSILLSSLRAIGDVAITLLKLGKHDIPSMLYTAAMERQTKRRREGAVAGLYALAVANRLGEDAAAPLTNVVYDGSLPVYTRDQALEAIGFLPKGAVNSEELANIVQLARGATGTAESSQWRAIELLIRHEFVPGTQYDELLDQKLKLRKADDRWMLSDTGPIGEWQGFSIALLWHKHPAAFAPAVAEVVRRSEMFTIYPTLGVLAPAQLHNVERRTASGPIADALVERIKSRMTKGVAETELFRVLCRLDPHRLVREPWDRFWDNWLPDAQVAFADELSQANLEESGSIDRAVSLLTALIGEGPYAVRRAAYRAMVQIRPDALDSYCQQWAEGSIDERRRAAEASGWSQERGNDRLETTVLAALLVDPDRSVRDAAARSLRERRNRFWADGYLDRVLAVRGNGNDEVLQTYCCGQALVQVGDDEHQRRLEQHLVTAELPPHVQHWLRRLIKGIEKQWQDVTEKWPEPWLSWGGTVEELDGHVIVDNTSPAEAHFSLWRKGRSSPSDRSSWGGVVRSSSIGFQHIFAASHYVTLQIPGRKDATAIMGRVTASSSDPTHMVVVLHGSGTYPEEQLYSASRT